MKIKNYFIILLSLALVSFYKSEDNQLTPAERMYSSIICYADSFEVPL